MKIFLLLFIVATFAVIGEAINCYRCSNLFECAETIGSEVNCSTTYNACSKSVLELSNGTAYGLRGCATITSVPKSSVVRAENETTISSVAEYYCYSDLCNGAIGLSGVGNALIAVIVSLTTLFNFKY